MLSLALIATEDRVMLEYAFRRVLWVIPVIVAVAAVTFFLMYRAPGGPWDREKTLPAATMQGARRQVRARQAALGQPASGRAALAEGVTEPTRLATAFIDSQFLNYMTGVFRFDLGPSYASKGAESVQELIARKFPVSLKLGIVAHRLLGRRRHPTRRHRRAASEHLARLSLPRHVDARRLGSDICQRLAALTLSQQHIRFLPDPRSGRMGRVRPRIYSCPGSCSASARWPTSPA